MVNRSASKPSPPSRLKLVMIPVLGAIMLYLLLAPGDQAAVPTLVARPPTSAATKAVGAPHPDAHTAPVTWPAIPLAEVLSTNPFQRPEGLKPFTPPEPEIIPEPVSALEVVAPPPPTITPEEQAAKDEALAAELRDAAKAHRLTALVRTSRGIGAMVGDHVVMVGDKLDDRFRVAAIRADGVVLELIERPENTRQPSNK